MGKGDKKSRKGKIAKGSFGKKRPHKVKQPVDEIQRRRLSLAIQKVLS